MEDGDKEVIAIFWTLNDPSGLQGLRHKSLYIKPGMFEKIKAKGDNPWSPGGPFMIQKMAMPSQFPSLTIESG